jgi:hypothetical protein
MVLTWLISVTQQVFVDRARVAIYWPVGVTANGVTSNLWYGALSQTAEVDAVIITIGELITPINIDMQDRASCPDTTVCSLKQNDEVILHQKGNP